MKITVSLEKFIAHLSTFQELFAGMAGVSHVCVTVKELDMVWKARLVMLFSKHHNNIIDNIIELLTEGSGNFTSMISVWRVTAGRKPINTEDGQINYLEIQFESKYTQRSGLTGN